VGCAPALAKGQSQIAAPGPPASLGRNFTYRCWAVYEVNNLLAGVDMTERVAGAWMHKKMD
jgi:hypothetical protein